MKDEFQIRSGIGANPIPVDAVALDSEIKHHWIAVPSHVCRRRNVGLRDVVQVADQGRRNVTTCGTRAILDGARIFHDGELETSVARLCFLHQVQGRGVVVSIVRTVPINDHARDSAAEHVRDLCLYLCRIIGVVADIHVIAHPKPGHEVRINRCR